MSTTEIERPDIARGEADAAAATLLIPTPAVTAGRRERRLALDATPVNSERTAESELDDDLDAPRRPPLTVGRGSTAWVLATISLLCLWFVAYAVLLTPIQESHDQSALYDTFRQQLALETAPLGGDIAPGSPVALLSAPALGVIDVVVVEGTASGDLMAGPGHRRDTVLPGQAGVSVLYGRQTLFGGPFAHIGTARPGDAITVTTGQGVFIYTVTAVRHAGDTVPAPLTSGHGRLTLVSAEGTGRVGTVAPDRVVYVDAALKGDGQPTLAGRPTAVPMAERAMQGDPSALLPLSLALPLLIGAVVFVTWARARWGGWQTWLVGAPLVLACLWAVSQTAVQLLPNLL